MNAVAQRAEEIYYPGSASIEFPISILDTWIQFRRVEIRQDVFEHDLAVIRARTRFLKWEETLYPGTPVTIKYEGRRTTESTFYGYVTHVKPVTKMADEHYDVDIYCVAASRDLRRTDQNVWRNRSAPEIAADIARRFKLRVVTKQHPLRRPQTIQSGETYWEFLIRLAKKIGYGLRVESGYLIFLPMEDMVFAYASSAPRLTNTESRTADGLVIPRNLISMNMWGGDTDTSVDRVSDDSIVVALPPTGGPATRSRRGPRSAVKRNRQNSRYAKFKTGVVAHTRKEAEILAESDAAAGAMAIDAECEVEGDGYLSPYRPVYIKTRDKSMNGWWIVKSAVHRIDMVRNAYTCDLVVSTDSVESGRLPANPLVRFRDISEERRQGWSPSTLKKPKLRQVRSGFVVGQTKHNKNSARWVGF